jgi:hypothetical protein
MFMYHFTGTVPAISDMHSESHAVTVGSIPAAGKGAVLTCRAVAPTHTVAAHAAALLQ